MFNFYSISSSSAGNCLFVESNNTKLLIDVGISMKKINTELFKIGLSLDDINAILITHEHSDHCKSLKTITKKYSIPIYVNQETLNEINKMYEGIDNTLINIIDTTSSFKINDLKIKAFETPHDSANCYGYNIFKNNSKISIATDLGHVTDTIKNSISNSNFTFIESNYDLNMLSLGKYPYELKRRINSDSGHLSNIQCAEIISDLAKHKTNSFMLGHLSKENNFPELALKTVENFLLDDNINLNDIDIQVASRDCLSNLICLEK